MNNPQVEPNPSAALAEHLGAIQRLAAGLTHAAQREASLLVQVGQTEAQRDAARARVAALEAENEALRSGVVRP